MEIEESIIQSIETIADSKFKSLGYTITEVGKISSINGESFNVSIMEQEIECQALLHIKDVLKVGSVVLVQRPSNDVSMRFIVSVVS